MRPLCQKLREYRESKGITQTYIAKKTGKTPQRISALESGGIKLTADEFAELCIKGYGINPAIFFIGEFSKNENNKKYYGNILH
jgi:transcriptional regulator with XRE-family HTH domain